VSLSRRASTDLDATQIRKFRQFAEKRLEYKDVRALARKSTEIEETLIQLADAYCLADTTPLDVKIENMSGYSKKRLKAFRKRLQKVASQIEAISEVQFPTGQSAIEIMRAFGGRDLGGLVPMLSEERFEIISSFERLPSILRQYSMCLADWPHAEFRKKLSDRNWQALPLANLCAFVHAITNANHFENIASLLNLVDEFNHGSWGKAQSKRQPINSRWDGEGIRKNLQNFVQRNTAVWVRIQTLAKLAAERSTKD
jgi:hypothetical protein